MQEYTPRIADRILSRKLQGKGAVLIEGAKTLAEFDKILDTSKMKSPSFKMIITGIGDYAYQRKDGILIVPIGCLKD
jgi:hypothetical protein